MTIAICNECGMISTLLHSAFDDWRVETGNAIGTVGLPERPYRRHSAQIRLNVTTTEAMAEGNEWIEKSLPLLQRVAEMPANWDSEGSPPSNQRIVKAARDLLERLQGDRLGAIPVPFVCPVAGGGIQLEWSSPQKHLEIEFLDEATVVFLKEEQRPSGEITESGEYPVADMDKTRRLLDWFASL